MLWQPHMRHQEALLDLSGEFLCTSDHSETNLLCGPADEACHQALPDMRSAADKRVQQKEEAIILVLSKV